MTNDKEFILEQNCPFRQLMIIVSEKWTGPVLFTLSEGVDRPGEMTRRIPGISKKMLTQTLRTLEKMELLERIVYEQIPPKVEYKLTKQGTKFLDLIVLLEEWAEDNTKMISKVYALKSK